MHHGFVACGASEDEFHGFFERESSAFGGVAVVEVVGVFVFESGLQFVEDAAFLVIDEAF